MTTALMPLDPTVSPQQAARVLTIRADLLPPEIRDGRRARRTRSFVLISLVLVLAGLGSWYAMATAAKNDAEKAYNQTLEQLATVQNQQKKDKNVQKMVAVKQGNTALEKELKALLGQDMSWANLLDLVRKTGTDASVTVNEISGGLTADSTGANATSGAIGSLNVSGTADNKKEVAEYVEALGKLTFLSDPFVNSVTDGDDGKVTFALTVTITDEGLCGRFTAECESEGK
ncbi:PilN domain-containing protein [Actinoplanes sp. NPDC024001]|uniref:PilN domain-containing protein n=1 Tax=Actinoplanes sp. NPDC024001 TaxID=3154598 RepID=UPI0033CEEEE3